MQWIGVVGLVALVLCWIPQSYDTIRLGSCPVNRTFLVLSAVGSLSLALYAYSMGDPLFLTLNILTTTGAAINIYYKLFPRRPAHE